MKPLFQPKGIVVHHSATRDTDTISYDAIKRFHRGELGWDEIGYQYLIEIVDGRPVLFTGRGLQYEGAHCVGCNDMIGICVVGNYDKVEPGSVYADGKIEKLINLLTGLLHIYPHLTLVDIHYHRHYAKKTCPGTHFPDIALIREYVMSKVAPPNFSKAI